MKIIFKKPGKYKNGVPVKEISQNDVDQEKVFEIVDSNAVAYVDTGSAKQYKEPKAKKEKPVSEFTLKELNALAKEKEIDLGDAKKKEEILPIIEEFLKESE